MTYSIRRLTFLIIWLSTGMISSALAKPLPLSLEEALTRAQSDGTTLALASLDADDSRRDEASALAKLLPQASLGYSESNQIVNLKAYGFAQPGSPSVVGPFEVHDIHLDATMKVIDLAAVERYRAMRSLRHAGDATLQRAKADTIAATSTLYVELLRARSKVSDQQETLHVFEAIKTRSQHRLDAGLATILDVHRAEFRRSTQEQLYLSSQEEELRVRLALLHAIGAPLDLELELTDTLAFAQANLPPLGEALDAALKNRPEIHTSLENLDAATRTLLATRAQHLPSVDVQFRGGYNANTWDDLTWNRSVVGTASIPISAGGELWAKGRQAENAKKRAELLLRETKRQVEEDVRNTHFAYTVSVKHLKAAEENLILAREELELTTNRLNNGLGTSLDVDQAEAAVSSAVDTRVEALSRRALAWIAWCKATATLGRLLQPQLQ